MKPQLLKDLGLSVGRMKETLMNPKFCVQQKVDGQRMLIECRDGKAVAFSRNGEKIWNIPKRLSNYFSKFDGMAFDGEYIPTTDTYWVFDMIRFDREDEYIDRLADLEETLVPTKTIRILPTAYSVPDKVRLMRAVVVNHAEGVVFKALNAPYEEGGRANGYKFKLYNDVDCFVSAISTEKNSVDIAVFNPAGQQVEIGSVLCTIKVGLGDVLLVKYLYATEDHKLYQPAILNKRHDKSAEECLLEQLHYTCPDILDEDDILRLGSS